MPQTWIYGEVKHDFGHTTYRLRYEEVPTTKHYISKFESICKKNTTSKKAVCIQLSVITLDSGRPLTNWHGDEIPAEIIFTFDGQNAKDITAVALLTSAF